MEQTIVAILKVAATMVLGACDAYLDADGEYAFESGLHSKRCVRITIPKTGGMV